MKSSRMIGAALAIAVSAALAPSPAGAAVYSFDCITNNSATNCTAGETQLTMDVTAVSGGVRFLFSNIGAIASSVEQAFFDDGVLSGTTITIENGTGVVFAQDGSPGNLPGGNSISPQFDTSFSFSADPPPSTNGINPGETLGLVFSGGSVSLAGVLDDLNSGDLRVGLHVIAYANRGSESFVNRPGLPPLVGPVPEPGTWALLGSGLLALGGVARRRSKRLD